ncbi:MAG: hypothetical protein KC800_28905 [Candidatus Eremiobacteraeota bacterium]|nr:hypothetical protein [Candidatus Eremiobacteraeota bacterium]
MKYSNVQRQFSAAIMWSLFVMAMCSGINAQEFGESGSQRVRAEKFPLSLSAPTQWEVFTSNPDDPDEVLFLQTPKEAPYPATVSVSAHPVQGDWDEIVRRQSYFLLVHEGVPLATNEELRLRGAKGHKWVFNDIGPGGESKVYYRLYLLLPASVGGKRLLLLQGAAPAGSSPEFVPQLNDIARSLSWGLQTETD